MCLHYRKELGLKADSKIWLEILAQLGFIEELGDYGKFEDALRELNDVYGQEFTLFLESNKGQLLHLLIEMGRAKFAVQFARAKDVSFNVLDDAVNSAFLKLLINPQEYNDYLLDKIDASSIEIQTDTGNIVFLHHPKLKVSQLSLNLIHKICQHHKIDMFAPNPSTGETLLDRALKEKLHYNTYFLLFKILESCNKVLSESQALMFFTNNPGSLFCAIERFPKVLPSSSWELRDKSGDKPLIESVIKSGIYPDSDVIIQNEEYLYPYMELIASMAGNNDHIRYVFTDVLDRTSSEKYLNLLKKNSLRSILSDEDIMETALDSESVKLLRFAIEELGISPNTIVDREFALQRAAREYENDPEGQLFDYLVRKGAIACIEPVKCAYLRVSQPERINKLIRLGYELSPNGAQIIKQDLYSRAEENDDSHYTSYCAYELIIHPHFSHHFDARDRSISLLTAIEKDTSYESLLNLGADPRLVINSKGETVLHLLSKSRLLDLNFFKAFNITEEDLKSKGQAAFAPIEPIIETYSYNLLHCPIVHLYPRLFGFEIANVDLYLRVKQEVILGDKSMCVICREDYINSDEVLVGACKHAVHYECYNQLGRTNCPVCRKLILV